MHRISTQGADFAQLFSTEEFMAPDCTNQVPPIEVLYQDSALLVLSSNYVDFIWKGVARAQQESYQVEDVTSYTASEAPDGPMQETYWFLFQSDKGTVIEGK
jgi:hypothetical protein